MEMNNTPEREETRRYLGIDIGGTQIKWGVVRQDGSISFHGTSPTPSKAGIEQFRRTIEEIIARAKERGALNGIGICTAGIVDSERGMVLGGIENIPFLVNYPLRETFEEGTGLPVRVINDVNAVAIGEQWVGGGADCKTIFCISVGTGIGGSLLIDGKLFEGAHYRSCEIGYIDYGGEDGSFESSCSAKSLLRRAKAALGNGDLSEDELFRRIERGDPAVTRVYQDWIGGLARRIADIILVVDPEKLLIGGGVTERGDLLLKPLDRAVRDRLPEDFRDIVRIELASCGNKAGILGAVRHFINCTQTASSYQKN